MKNIAVILDKILAIAKDARVWLRVFILVVTGFVGAIAFSKTKVRNCDFCEKQKSELIQALIQIKTMEATTAIFDNTNPDLKVGIYQSSFQFASYSDTANPSWQTTQYYPAITNSVNFDGYGFSIDTTPKQRILNRYIDSVLNKIKQDSIRKSKNK